MSALRLLAIAMLAACESNQVLPSRPSACRSTVHGISIPAFHGGPARLGWTSQESLSPARVGGASFGLSWASSDFDGVQIAGQQYAGRAYASPLYADDVTIAGGPFDASNVSVLFVATSNGIVYAINAFDAPCSSRSIPPGEILWRASLVTPGVVPNLDGNLPMGTMSTPILDTSTTPPTLYVTAMDAQQGTWTWKVFALDASRGAVLPGWPVVLDRASVESVNRNGPAFFDDDARNVSQRGALALSPDGGRLYLTFGGYWDGAVGWIVAIDTRAPAAAASFSGAPDTLRDAQGNVSRHANAGMWAPSGPAVDAAGRVYMTTGNSEPSWETAPSTWGNSMLRWTKDLVLDSTYTPYDFCTLDEGDVDVGGSSVVLLPHFSALQTTTPSLLAFGSKAGVAYLLDTTNIPGGVASRPACSMSWDDSAHDGSLLPPSPSKDHCNTVAQATCVAPAPSTDCARGPLVIFGPAGDVAAVDHAKMRTTPAYFESEGGTPYLYFSGSTKAALCAVDVVPPSIVRVRIAADAGGPAYLVQDAADTELRLVNPGSPVVSSDGGRDPIVWVVDENALRSASLLASPAQHPELYAVDGTTMQVLYRSEPGDLDVGGKYMTPVVAHGTVFVVTDRVQAFSAP
ncbi:MAG TPA: hypothetical protein VGH28_17530 [Polyangiaceae bacterium]|jgi:hypothetical protein